MKKLACVLCWFILSVHPLIAGEIPAVLHIPEAGTSYPAWVAAERVLTPSGEIDSSLFSPGDQHIISGYLRLPAREGCIRLGRHDTEFETNGPHKAVRPSLASTAKSAGWIFSATVTNRAPGFHSSEPGTLLEVIPEKVFKGPRDRRGVHYVFIPIATFSLGGTKICKTDDRYAVLPEIGERVVLFAHLFWQNEGRFLSVGGDSGIITIKESGSISLPRRYHRTEAWLEGGEESELLGFIQKNTEREN
jgi:hypothetical protein